MARRGSRWNQNCCLSRLNAVGMLSRRTVLAATAGLLISGCGYEATVTTGQPPGDPDRRYTTTALVLESPDHGPQLCLGGVEESLPPQCGGLDIVGWDWGSVDDAESVAGTTWGEYVVIGTYDGERFTLTEQATPPTDREADQADVPRPSTPCDAPPGGWAVVDPSTATQAGLSAAQEYASGQPTYAALWVDQPISPALADGAAANEEMLANDPTKLILNVRFTGDLEEHERALRAMWGGALCVSKGEHTEAELLAIQAEMNNEPRMLSSSIDGISGVVDVYVIVDDGTPQRRFDEKFGAGAVRVTSALQPLD